MIEYTVKLFFDAAPMREYITVADAVNPTPEIESEIREAFGGDLPAAYQVASNE